MIESEMVCRSLNVPPLPNYPVRGVAKQTRGHRVFAFLVTAFVATILMVTPMFGPIASIIVVVVAGVIAFVVTQVNGKRLPSSLSKDESAALDKGRKDGVTELMIVAASGNVERTVELLNYGARADSVTKNGLTPMMYAAGSGQAATYLELLKRGGNADARSKRGLTAIEIAEERGFLSFRDAVASIGILK